MGGFSAPVKGKERSEGGSVLPFPLMGSVLACSLYPRTTCRRESEMKDTELYAALLKLRHPWGVREVKVDLAAERVDV